MKLPPKHPDVAAVTDAQWEAALDMADRDWRDCNPAGADVKRIIHHARCLILLGEVPKPVGAFYKAVQSVYMDFMEDSADESWHEQMDRAIRKHLAPFLKDGVL